MVTPTLRRTDLLFVSLGGPSDLYVTVAECRITSMENVLISGRGV